MSPGLKCFTLVPHTALQLLSPIRRYYSQSLELNPDQNARAAFGLVLAPMFAAGTVQAMAMMAIGSCKFEGE